MLDTPRYLIMTDVPDGYYWNNLNREIYIKNNPAMAALRGEWLTTLRFDYIPNIKQEDLDRTYITRYFCRRANLNDGEIVEISRQTMNKLKKYSIFKFVEVPWKIKGQLDDIPGPNNINTPTRLFTGVITSNTEMVNMKNKEMPGLKNKLSNPLQYYQGI